MTTMRPALLLLLLLLLASAAAQAQDWTASAALSSDYRLRGLSLSRGKPAQMLDLGVASDGGWNVDLGAAALGRDGAGRRTLLTASVARSWQWDGGWGADLGISHWAWPGPAWRRAYDYDELRATLRWRGQAAASLACLPHVRQNNGYGTIRSGSACSAEASWSQALGRGFGLQGGLGAYAQSPGHYVYGSAALAWARGPGQLLLARIASNAHSQGFASADDARPAWVLTASLSY